MSSRDRHPIRALGNLLVVLVVAVLIALAYAWFRGSAPAIKPVDVPIAVGQQRTIEVSASSSAGVASIEAHFLQAGKTIALGHQTFAARRWFTTGNAPREIHFLAQAGRNAHPELADGPVTLVVTARAANLRGAATTWRKNLTVQTTPPRVYALTAVDHVIQGGSAVVVYHVSPGATSSGVEVDGKFFPGYPVPNAAPGIHFALYAFPYNAPNSAIPHLIARDDAGNQATAKFNVDVVPQKYRQRRITISDSYIRQTVLPIIANTPSLHEQGNLEKDFLLVNHGLRRTDAQQLADAAKQTVAQFLWHGAFHQLKNSAVEAQFADHRDYVYDGKVVDQESHLGYDLAAVRHTPVLAANAGRVVWAKYFGIYGNCILLDHGYGLMSLYAHLNDFQVKAGDTVAQDQLIAHSDSTGLAGGDHLHYSMLIDGVQVNPLEWWDPNWVRSHIEANLASYAGSATP